MLFSKILVAYDGSKASNKALDRAIELAKVSPNAVLDVIHAFDFPRVFIGEGWLHCHLPLIMTITIWQYRRQMKRKNEFRLRV